MSGRALSDSPLIGLALEENKTKAQIISASDKNKASEFQK
jgi:hypothetical protein